MKNILLLAVCALSLNIFAQGYSKDFAYETFLIEFSTSCDKDPTLESKMPKMCDGSFSVNDLRKNHKGNWYVSFHPEIWLYKFYTLNSEGEIIISYLEED